MAMTFTTNQAGANADYMKYVSGPVTKSDKVNSPDLLDFTLVNFDGALVPLKRGSHIVLTTATYGVWFTGFITNDPELAYLGTSKGVPQWGYKYEASGEEYMLNQKPFGIVAPFTNTTQGAVLRYLIELLTPAGISFDTTGIQDGQALPRFIVDPNKHFSEIVQTFCKSAHFQFRCQNYVAKFFQQDFVPGLIVDGNNQHFTPSQLNMKASGDPIINDSIILGAIEPQKYMEEYFMGDGATAQFNLISSVFGVDSTLLIDDDMSNSSIDTSKWTVYDASNSWITPYGGTLNVLGGSNNDSLDVYLQSQSLIPLEGNLRMTHGEWDFISASDGVLGGLWKGQCDGPMSNLLLGIKAQKSGSATILHPAVNGVVDTTQTVNIDYTKRYVMRTLLSSRDAKRNAPGYAYRTSNGLIRQISLAIPSDNFYATTVITEIDPITALTTNQWTWTSDLGSVSAVAAYYVPVASNSLNLTVCSITVGVPLQASLSSIAAGTSTWVQQVIGHNEVDSIDGMAPAATIVDSNNGASTRNSLMGSANYNPGQATLTYFKDTARLQSYLPNPGDVVHLSYRSAGAAIGRARDTSSIVAEAAAWGDDGVRSETKRDLSPLPMTSLECEMAATARVNDNSYQHWSGSYTIPSGYSTSNEPLAGTLILFRNLPTQFPSYLNAESITSVKTTLVSLIPAEQFTHAVDFGPTSALENMLASIKVTSDVFTPQDTAEIPQFVDVSALGDTSLPAAPNFLYTGKDADNWYFTFTESFPSGVGGVEIRYSDSGWGVDAGNNLLARVASMSVPHYTPIKMVENDTLFGRRLPILGTASTNGFAVPRTVRGKVVFLRCYDTRNKCLWSEDLTNSAWVKTGTTVSSIRMKDIDGNLSIVNQFTMDSAGDSIYQTTTAPANNSDAVFSIDLFGPAGTSIYLQVKASGAGSPTPNVLANLTGKWQRFHLPVSFPLGQAGTFICGLSGNVISPTTIYATKASLEIADNETLYCKTNGSVYGSTSRNSTGVHVGLPLVPPSPTATGDFTRINAPIVKMTLPADLTDVWGCEIRAEDNLTVLFHTDLSNAQLSLPTLTGDASMVLQTTAPALTNRSYSYWVYTYNLFGEYSAGYNLAGTISPPAVLNLTVDNRNKEVVWTGSNATAYDVYVDTVDTTLTNLSVSAATTNTFFPLADGDFFGLRYIAVTPYDAIGPGVTMGGWFQYTPGVGSWPPATTVTNPSFESGDATGWTLGTNWGVGQGHSVFGSWSAYVAGTLISPLTSTSSITSTYHLAVTPGSVYQARVLIDGSFATGASAGGYVTLTFYNVSNVQLSQIQGNTVAVGGLGWNLSYISGAAPAGATYAIVGCTVVNQSTGTVYADNFDASAIPSVPPGIPAGQVFYKLGNVGPDNNIHISTSLNPQGSVLPNQPIPINYTTTDTEIDLAIDAQSLLRADGSTLTVPSASTSYTGLSPSTTYYFYAYINTSTGALGFTNPNPPSTSANGTQAMQAYFDGRISLGPLSLTTPASGGGGTTGSGGGVIRCPEQTELVDVEGKGSVEVGSVLAGDFIKGWSFKKNTEVYRKVIQTSRVLCASWRVVNGYRCSPTEPIYLDGKWVLAYRAPGATQDQLKSYKIALSVETDEYDEQNYYLVKGEAPLLIHNMPIEC